MAKSKKGWKARNRTLPRVLKDWEIQKLYAVADERERLVLDLYLRSGMRKAEGLKLKVRDIDFRNHTIFINQGKGDKDRLIPLDKTLAVELQAYIKKWDMQPDDYILSIKKKRGMWKDGPHYYKDTKPYNTMHVYVMIRELGDKAGLDACIPRDSPCKRYQKAYRIRPHMLRHTYGTMIQEAVGDPFVTKEVLGHSCLQMTEIYVHLSQKRKQAAVDEAFKHLSPSRDNTSEMPGSGEVGTGALLPPTERWEHPQKIEPYNPDDMAYR